MNHIKGACCTCNTCYTYKGCPETPAAAPVAPASHMELIAPAALIASAAPVAPDARIAHVTPAAPVAHVAHTMLHNFCRISYSTDGYVWTAYSSQPFDADLGEVFYREADTTHIEFNPPIRV